jgi:hypothetical protein
MAERALVKLTKCPLRFSLSLLHNLRSGAPANPSLSCKNPLVYGTTSFQSRTSTSLEDVIEHIKKNFDTEKNWEKLMKKYFDKVKLFI